MNGWVTTDNVLDFLKAHVAKAGGETLQDHWTPIVDASVRRAYGDIVSAFTARGFTKAQIDLWDRGAEFQLDIATWAPLMRLAAMQPEVYGTTALNTIDRRCELWGDDSKGIPAVALTINGVIQDPAGGYDQVTTGPMDTSTDLFGVFDPDDARRGEVTRF